MARWRAAFKTDVVVDLNCYRKHGHNEGDEPSFTHPLMYRTIGRTPDTLRRYSDQLLAEGVVSKQECAQVKEAYGASLSLALEESKEYEAKDFHWLESVWLGFKSPVQKARIKATGVDMAVLKRLGTAMCR